MTTETSIDVMAELGILEPHEVAQLLKLRHSTVLDLSRRGVLPAFKIGKDPRQVGNLVLQGSPRDLARSRPRFRPVT